MGYFKMQATKQDFTKEHIAGVLDKTDWAIIMCVDSDEGQRRAEIFLNAAGTPHLKAQIATPALRTAYILFDTMIATAVAIAGLWRQTRLVVPGGELSVNRFRWRLAPISRVHTGKMVGVGVITLPDGSTFSLSFLDEKEYEIPRRKTLTLPVENGKVGAS